VTQTSVCEGVGSTQAGVCATKEKRGENNTKSGLTVLQNWTPFKAASYIPLAVIGVLGRPG